MDIISTDPTLAKILTLYKQGFSCKDIAKNCNLSIVTIRKTLKEAGYDTRSYRKASEGNKAKALLLMKTGYSYKQIEELLHVSRHLTREIVEENGLLGVAPKNHPPIELNIDSDQISSEKLKLLYKAYLSGEYGLVKLSDIYCVSDDEFVWFVFHLTAEDKNIHHKCLRKNIRKMFKADIPVTAIAKAMDISPSIVKKMI